MSLIDRAMATSPLSNSDTCCDVPEMLNIETIDGSMQRIKKIQDNIQRMHAENQEFMDSIKLVLNNAAKARSKQKAVLGRVQEHLKKRFLDSIQ